MRVYHFLSERYGLDDIARRRLKVATIDDLNDPFEMQGLVLGNARERALYARLLDKIASMAGILCFSESWQNPVQWSHYADRHRGLCLGFDVPEHRLMKVIYRRRFAHLFGPAGSVDFKPMTFDDMINLLRSKYLHWQYEREWRTFEPLGECIRTEEGLYFQSFGPELRLAEVIVGSRASTSRNQLHDSLGDLADHVGTRKARLSFRDYKVVTQKDAALWA